MQRYRYLQELIEKRFSLIFIVSGVHLGTHTVWNAHNSLMSLGVLES